MFRTRNLSLPFTTNYVTDTFPACFRLFVEFSPLRVAPGLGAYNSKFVGEIEADADAVFAQASVTCAAAFTSHACPVGDVTFTVGRR